MSIGFDGLSLLLSLLDVHVYIPANIKSAFIA